MAIKNERGGCIFDEQAICKIPQTIFNVEPLLLSIGFTFSLDQMSAVIKIKACLDKEDSSSWSKRLNVLILFWIRPHLYVLDQTSYCSGLKLICTGIRPHTVVVQTSYPTGSDLRLFLVTS